MHLHLCKYKPIFGAEGQGVHSIRIAGIAIVDVIFTVIAGIALAYIFKWDALVTVGALFILGVMIHRIFCVNTTVNKYIFGVV